MPEGDGVYRLSITAAKRFLECPKQWWFYYRSDLPRPEERLRPDFMRRGSATHKAFEAAFLARQEDLGAPCAGERMGEYSVEALSALRTAWDAEGLPLDGDSLREAQRAVVATLEALPAPRPADILGVERRMELTTGAGTEILVILDLLLRVSADRLRVVDWKYRRRVAEKAELEGDLQLLTYAAAVQDAYPATGAISVGHYYPPVQTGQQVIATPSRVDGAIAQLDAVMEMISTEEAFDPVVSKACKSCPWKLPCPAYPKDPT